MRAGAAGVSGLAALALLLPMEAGVPIPLPADLVMFTVGERVAAGRFPLWLATAGFEVIAAVGTTALFVAYRGPAHGVIARYGPPGPGVGRADDAAEARWNYAFWLQNKLTLIGDQRDHAASTQSGDLLAASSHVCAGLSCPYAQKWRICAH